VLSQSPIWMRPPSLSTCNRQLAVAVRAVALRRRCRARRRARRARRSRRRRRSRRGVARVGRRDRTARRRPRVAATPRRTPRPPRALPSASTGSSSTKVAGARLSPGRKTRIESLRREAGEGHVLGVADSRRPCSRGSAGHRKATGPPRAPPPSTFSSCCPPYNHTPSNERVIVLAHLHGEACARRKEGAGPAPKGAPRLRDRSYLGSGPALVGSEVKSLRESHAQISDGYAELRHGGVLAGELQDRALPLGQPVQTTSRPAEGSCCCTAGDSTAWA
jgi:hypothetical protein